MKGLAAVFSVLVLLSPACSSTYAPPSAAAGISGIVTTSGSALPGVTVTLLGPHGSVRVVVSDSNGVYRFTAVPPGSYKIRFELSGLTPAFYAVVVNGRAQVINGEMKVASVAEAITVTAEAPQLSISRSVRSSALKDAHPAPFTTRQSLPIAESDFIQTRREATTTFAIDVDRASYANVRRMLSQNLMPPPDAVRLEEMVNYFTYSYPQPSGSEPFSVTSEVAGCPWDPTHRLMRIGIQGRNLDEWKMAPNNLVFLIDVSGSMDEPTRLPLIQSAFHLLVDKLRAQDTVSIVVYAGEAGLVLPPTSGADKQTILGAIDRLAAGGSTAGGEGIELAYKIATENFKRDGNNRVILATDGDFNVGISEIKDLEHFIEEKRKTGVFLTTIGVGDDNYRDAVLETLADKGNGNYAYLDSMNEAKKVFERELTGTLVTIAKDVKVQIAFDRSRVVSYRQLGYEDRALANKDFEDDTKDAGELGAGHSVTALYEIVPVANASRGELASIKLRYKEPNGETSKLVASSAVDTGTSAYAASADLQFAAAVAEFAMLLRQSPHKGTSSFSDVAALARASHGVDLDGTREELLRLVETSRALSGEGGTIARK
jgi:Ca-activated chloride channel family protein